jgi:hypothetical protein
MTGKFMSEGGIPRGFDWRPLSELTVSELRSKADNYYRMAATATTQQVMESLRKLADHLEELADQRERDNQSDY